MGWRSGCCVEPPPPPPVSSPAPVSAPAPPLCAVARPLAPLFSLLLPAMLSLCGRCRFAAAAATAAMTALRFRVPACLQLLQPRRRSLPRPTQIGLPCRPLGAQAGVDPDLVLTPLKLNLPALLELLVTSPVVSYCTSPTDCFGERAFYYTWDLTRKHLRVTRNVSRESFYT